MQGDTEITYGLDRKFWAQGITTQALKIFLAIETARPFLDELHLTILSHRKY